MKICHREAKYMSVAPEDEGKGKIWLFKNQCSEQFDTEDYSGINDICSNLLILIAYRAVSAACGEHEPGINSF